MRDVLSQTSATLPNRARARPIVGWTVSNWRTAAAQRRWASALLLFGLFPLLYGGIAIRLVRTWSEVPDFSHGFLIPPFVLLLLWDRREVLRATPIQPSWAGISLVVAALGMLMLGVLGSVNYFSRASFVVLIAGIVWTLYGRQMLGRTRFILFVLLLAIPLPTLILNQITFPLQLFASKVASAMLPLAGVPVLRDGNMLQLPAIQIEVAEACSGIRSLMSLFTVAIIYGYFLEHSTWRRLLLALASVPIAIAANVVRVFAAGLCIQYWDPEKALGFFHEFSGWLIFLVSLSCLYLLQMGMRRATSGSIRL